MKSSNNLLNGILIGMAIMTLTAFTAENFFTLKFSEPAINKHYQKLSAIKQIVDKSNLAHQEVIFVKNSIDSLQAEILTQVKVQLAQETSSKK